MLTTEQLNAIKERAEKAAAGPWEYIESDNVIITLDGDCHFVMEVAEELGHGFDGIFIAHAREDIPALLQTVEALSAILTETEETRDKIAKDWSKLLDERVTLKAKIATYESLAQEFDYGAILDEMACEGGGTDD